MDNNIQIFLHFVPFFLFFFGYALSLMEPENRNLPINKKVLYGIAGLIITYIAYDATEGGALQEVVQDTLKSGLFSLATGFYAPKVAAAALERVA